MKRWHVTIVEPWAWFMPLPSVPFYWMARLQVWLYTVGRRYRFADVEWR